MNKLLFLLTICFICTGCSNQPTMAAAKPLLVSFEALSAEISITQETTPDTDTPETVASNATAPHIDEG